MEEALYLAERARSGVSQGSILVPFLVNIFLNDPFLFTANSNLRNYADVNNLYATGQKLGEIKQILQEFI